MEGLEITIFNKKDILNDNIEFRLDAEYYKNEFLELYKKIKDAPILDDLVYMSDLSTNGSFATVANIIHDNNEKIIPFIRSGNVGNTFINKSDLEFISREAHEKLPKSTTHLHDIMMARKGKIGGASIIMESDVNFNCNENVIKLTINDIEKINPFYFTVFFNCKYGLKQIERLSTGNVQPWVSIFQIRKLIIPILSLSFQTQIENLVKLAHSKLEESKTLYTSAENLLLSALGLNDFESKKVETNYNIKSFKDSFFTSGRLDAEYYQPKYEELEKHLRKFEMIKLSDLVSYQVTSGSTPKAGGDDYTDAENGIPFVRAVDLVNNRVSIDNFIYIKKSIHNTVLRKTQLKKNDVLFSIAGTVGRCAIFDHDFEANINQAVSILRFDETKVMRICLVVFFNSWVGNMYIEKYARQGVQTNLNLQEVANLEVPILPQSIQSQISSQVQESFVLRAESERLLALAKEKVEQAIEGGE